MAQSKRQGGAAEEGEPCVKRPCMSQAALLRAGSVESACTGLGPVPASAAPAAAAGSGAAPAAPTCPLSPAAACQPPAKEAPGSCGSDESLQSPLDAALLQVPGSGGSAASAPAAEPAPAVAQAQQQQREQQQAAAAEPHCTLPHAFLAELAAANARVQCLPLPGKLRGGLPFYPVHPSCMMLPLWVIYGVSPAAVVLGASYFQRLLVVRDHLRQAADAAGYFSAGAPGEADLVMHARPSSSETLVAAYCACVYLGIKLTDGVQFSNQLSHMLTNALGTRVDPDNAVGLEMQVLRLLDWRLGPYCCKPRHMGPW
ncbi:hypothetical protein ABPG75_009308 [Micractinium tetrahymenae]